MIAPEPLPEVNAWERLLYRRVPLWLVVLLVLTLIVGALVLAGAVEKAKGKGSLSAFAQQVADIPKTLKALLRGHGDRPYARRGYARLSNGLSFDPAHRFVDPGYLLLSAFEPRIGRPVVRLIRLADGRILREYQPDIAAINRRSHFRSAIIDLRRDRGVTRNLMMHPLLMPDGGLIIHDSSPLARVDACGRPEWVVDGIFHHAVERDADGSIWAIYRYPRSPMKQVEPTFADEAIAHVGADGRMLGLARIADILDRNGLGMLWRGRPYVDDPFHLNEVQPALSDGPYWRKGDLLLSLRNQSLVMLYRPATGRVIWHRIGPWRMQHDAAFVDDHRISVFDNNWAFASPEGVVEGTNRLPAYDFATDSVTFPFAKATWATRLRTSAQGRATPMANGDMVVEETERGRILRLSPQGEVRWRYISADARKRRYQLRWSRYLDPAIDGPAIQAAVNAKCP